MTSAERHNTSGRGGAVAPMRNWSFWEWIAYATLAMAAAIEAAEGGLKGAPTLAAKMPTILPSEIMSFVPLGLVVFSTFLLLIRHWLTQAKRIRIPTRIKLQFNYANEDPDKIESTKPISHSLNSNLPWLIRRQGRIVASLVACAVAYLLTMGLPHDLNLLIAYNVGVGVYLVLTLALMRRASPEDAAELSRRVEPNNLLVLIVVNALSVASLVGVAAMLNHPNGRPRWVVNLHMTTSLLAIILSWLLAHIYFGLHYMRLYYDDAMIGGKLSYQKGLEFPQRETADFWDFMYYSFTIAMCYSTSDVSVTSVKIRHVTLVHAIFSSLFFTVIIGFTVNIILNVT